MKGSPVRGGDTYAAKKKDGDYECRSDVILFSRTFQGEEPLDTGGGRIFSLDASFGLLATASASTLALFLGSALSFCGVSWMICELYHQKKMARRLASHTCIPPLLGLYTILPLPI